MIAESDSWSRGQPNLRIFRFWLPLAMTWLMMAMEGPVISAIIARMPEPKYNLATYGLALAFALLLEAPIIMMLTAATVFIKDHQSYKQLFRFSYSLNLFCTVCAFLIVLPPIYQGVVRLLNVPRPVASLLHTSLILLIPWPAAIGIRRFYQGLLIRFGKTRLVAIGTVLRLTAMISTCLTLFYFFKLPGAYVGSAALSVGVCCEALVVWLIARPYVATLPSRPSQSDHLSFGSIWSFYSPLALTSLIALTVQPIITFFVGWCAYPLESLAILPVINALIFIFRGLGLSYQEVAVTLLGDRFQGYEYLRKFCQILTVIFTALLALVAFTPLARIWFHELSGLSNELTNFALNPLKVMILIPALAFYTSLHRAVAVQKKITKVITAAICFEVAMIVAVLLLGVRMQWNGAFSACLSMALGRLTGCLFLVYSPETSSRSVIGAESSNIN